MEPADPALIHPLSGGRHTTTTPGAGIHTNRRRFYDILSAPQPSGFLGQNPADSGSYLAARQSPAPNRAAGRDRAGQTGSDRRIESFQEPGKLGIGVPVLKYPFSPNRSLRRLCEETLKTYLCAFLHESPFNYE